MRTVYTGENGIDICKTIQCVDASAASEMQRIRQVLFMPLQARGAFNSCRHGRGSAPYGAASDVAVQLNHQPGWDED